MSYEDYQDEATQESGGQTNGQFREFVSEFIDFNDVPVTVVVRFKKPSQGMCGRAVKDMGRSPGRAYNNLLMACVHNDDRSALQTAMEKNPGLSITFGTELLERVGFSAEVANRLGK